MFFLILFLILSVISIIAIGLCYFLADRLTAYFSLPNKKVTFAILLWSFTFICCGAFGFVHTKNTVAIVIHWITCLALGVFLYLVFSVIFIEPLRRIVKFSNKKAGIAALVGAILIPAYGVYNAYQLVITERTIPIHHLTKTIKAVHITDTHIGQFRSKKNLQEIVNVINKINPEVVFHTGDLLDSRVHLDDDVLAPLADIKAPIFFVHGNHDTDTGILEIEQELRKLNNLTYLKNAVTNWNGIEIVGLNFMYADDKKFSLYGKKRRLNVKNVIGQLEFDKSKPVILLHHGPYGTKYAQGSGVDLYLAGHTHGGQVFPFNYLNEYIFEYNAGLYDLKGMKINIPFGVGTYGFPIRIGTNSELTVLNLVPK